MHLSIVLILLGSWMNSGQVVADFTINSIGLLSGTSTRLSKGEELRLRCIADIARTTGLELSSIMFFYKDDRLIYNVTTTKDRETYTISRARVSDTGFYRCRIVAQGKEKKSKELQIKVSGLLAPDMNVSKTEVTEGEEITVRCDVPDEDPPMQFIFYKTSLGGSIPGQEVKEEKTRHSNEKYAEYQFEIKEGEAILHFECTVKLMNIPEDTSPPSRRQTVTVSEPFGKPNINIKPSNNFTEGKVMEVTCSVRTSHLLQEKVVLYLQKGNQLLNSSTSETLTYSKMATVDDIGNYSCKAEGTKASKTTSTMVRVDELFPKPRLEPTQRDINEGESLFLKCYVPGLPIKDSDVLNFYFRVKGQRYMATGGRFFRDVTERDSGEYTCEVTISNITKTSNPVPVRVYAPVSKPILKHIVKGNKMVVLGDTLTLTCMSLVGTPPIRYTLYRGNEYLGSVEMRSRMEAIFTVNATKPDDLGQYRCHSSNQNKKVVDMYSDFVNVTVITPVGDVDLLVIPKNGEVEEGAVLALVCRAKSGTLPITFWFYVQRVSDLLLHSVNKTDNMHAEHQVTSFAKEKEGRYFCVASNMANKSMQSTSTEVKAVLATWKKGVIGVFICLIIVAAIGIIVYLYMDKKKKGKMISTDSSRTEKSSDSHKKPVVDLRSENEYIAGSPQNEEELHILKTDENIGNSQQNHDVEYTEADGSPPEPQQDTTENNLNKL
ncbi:platelet endothelial cell adhesion molecule [Hyperolius riggenbachi]|uniref:platelet endothelial cell adhesion molecule n=1 Tax=Hyperolius riggenbachi TaxID=752182 RepID=UPI0035A2BAFD